MGWMDEKSRPRSRSSSPGQHANVTVAQRQVTCLTTFLFGLLFFTFLFLYYAAAPLYLARSNTGSLLHLPFFTSTVDARNSIQTKLDEFAKRLPILKHQSQLLGEAAAIRESLPPHFNDGRLRLSQVLHHASSEKYRGLFRVHNVDEKSPFIQQTEALQGQFENGYPIATTYSASFMGEERIPNVTDRSTVLSLATMCFDSYTVPSSPDWISVGTDWHVVRSKLHLSTDHRLMEDDKRIWIGVGRMTDYAGTCSQTVINHWR